MATAPPAITRWYPSQQGAVEIISTSQQPRFDAEFEISGPDVRRTWIGLENEESLNSKLGIKNVVYLGARLPLLALEFSCIARQTDRS